ncbi:MAG: hypothetical protein LBS09_02030 [Bacteroidales bacterium]|jgi:hypothetical protein|nr:hypothetical protein [Bacteroidales bacterium]
MNILRNITIVVLCALTVACSVKHPERQNSTIFYSASDIEHLNVVFVQREANETDRVQPVLTQIEYDILDVLAERIDPATRLEFDDKCLQWMSCWMYTDTETLLENPQYALKCNEKEYKELIRFCAQQDEHIMLLFCRLAAHSKCPYDRFLMRPVLDLSEHFPEYRRFWNEINAALIKEKPTSSTCNETTIWYMRKILESKYGYTYASRLMAVFDAERLLLMAL